MPVEVANALHRRVVRSELTVAAAARLMEYLAASGIELQETPYLHGRAMELAAQLRQGAVYDSHYLGAGGDPRAVICGPLTRGSIGR